MNSSKPIFSTRLRTLCAACLLVSSYAIGSFAVSSPVSADTHHRASTASSTPTSVDTTHGVTNIDWF